MLSLLFHVCVDMIFGPVIDAVVTGFSFGTVSNILNNGKLLWNMDK